MARPPRFRSSLLADLFRQTSFAPPETHRRQLDAAEKLLRELAPDRLYPEDYVIFRITGYRKPTPEVAQFVGAALVADLAILIERVSAALLLPARSFQRAPVTLPEAARILSVSPTTLHRLRRKGLVAHVVRDSRGKPQPVIFRDSLDWFIATGRHRSEFAPRGRRIPRPERDRILAQARRWRRWAGLSLHQAALRIAARTHRSPQSITLLIQRHDRANPAGALFPEHHALTAREHRLIHRARARAVPVADIARRLGRTRTTIYRLINETRAQRLRACRLTHFTLPTFALPAAADVILAAPPVTTNLSSSVESIAAAGPWVAAVHALTPPSEDDELALLAAFNFLKHRAHSQSARLPRTAPSAARLDEIETALRWALLLKRRLFDALLPTLLVTLEQSIDGRLLDRPPSELRALHLAACSLLSSALDEFDPSKNQRLAAYFAFQLRRELAKRILARPSPHPENTALPLNPAANLLTPWQRDLALPLPLRSAVAALNSPHRDIITLRFGLAGSFPRTLNQTAAELHLTRSAAALHEERALRLLPRLARSSPLP